MEVYEVSPAVNKVANDTPELVEPFSGEGAPPAAAPKPKRQKKAGDTGQGSLF